MHSKIKGLIFSFVLVVIVVVSGIYISKKRNEVNPENSAEQTTEQQAQNDDKEALSSEETDEYDDQKALEEERNAFMDAYFAAVSSPEYHKGEYKDCNVSVEVNPDFITDELHFRRVFYYYEIEFVGYEELDDISDYVDKNGWDRTSVDYSFRNAKEAGYVNEDGTLNKVDRTICRLYDDWEEGEETVLEDQEVVAVKLKIKYTNLKDEKNDIAIQPFSCTDMVYMEDGKLYDKSTLYYSKKSTGLFSWIICTNMGERIKPGYTSITLYPREEYVGEVIILFLREDFDEIYLDIHEGQQCNYDDFNAFGEHFLPLTELKKLEGK